MLRLEFSRDALADLDAIYLHGLVTFGAEQAERYTQVLDGALRLICDYPAAGPLLDNRTDGMRRRSAGSHAIFYSVDAGCLRITRVLHQHMDSTRHV